MAWSCALGLGVLLLGAKDYGLSTLVTALEIVVTRPLGFLLTPMWWVLGRRLPSRLRNRGDPAQADPKAPLLRGLATRTPADNEYFAAMQGRGKRHRPTT